MAPTHFRVSVYASNHNSLCISWLPGALHAPRSLTLTLDFSVNLPTSFASSFKKCLSKKCPDNSYQPLQQMLRWHYCHSAHTVPRRALRVQNTMLTDQPSSSMSLLSNSKPLVIIYICTISESTNPLLPLLCHSSQDRSTALLLIQDDLEQ